jgi:Predicted ATPase with chaperone activity
MLVKTNASAVKGIEAQLITVEVNAGGNVTIGNNFYHLVGLPDNAVKEGFQRIEAAIKNIGFKMFRLKLVVNLAPADIRKEGSAYDLPIALGILSATKQISGEMLPDYVIMGELAVTKSPVGMLQKMLSLGVSYIISWKKPLIIITMYFWFYQKTV